MRFLLLVSMASTVFADGAAILLAMSSITNSTLALNTTVSTFPSGIAGLADIFPLLSASTTLLASINHATYIASSSANLTLDESVSVAVATNNLAAVVNSTLTSLIGKKAVFDKLVLVSPVVLLNLELEKSATDQFGSAVVGKVPEAVQAFAETLLVSIDDSFEEGISAYTL